MDIFFDFLNCSIHICGLPRTILCFQSHATYVVKKLLDFCSESFQGTLFMSVLCSFISFRKIYYFPQLVFHSLGPQVPWWLTLFIVAASSIFITRLSLLMLQSSTSFLMSEGLYTIWTLLHISDFNRCQAISPGTEKRTSLSFKRKHSQA